MDKSKSMPTGRHDMVIRAGTQTAALAFGGKIIQDLIANTEEYDGSSWTAGGALPLLELNMLQEQEHKVQL